MSFVRALPLLAMTVADVHLKARIAWFCGKGRDGEKEAASISAVAAEALRVYFGTRSDLCPDSPVFASLDPAAEGERTITPAGVNDLVQHLGLKAGVGAVNPHDLRRAGARALAKAGASAESLRAWGRWSDFATPAKYVGAGLAQEKAREAVELVSKVS